MPDGHASRHFDDMKEFFAILFFGKVVLLTPNPVTVDDHIDLDLDDPIVAVTTGAGLEIDVSSMIVVTDILATRRALRSRFPEDCLRATLFSSDSQVVLSRMGSLISDDSALISLSSDSGVPLKTEFSRIELDSCVRMTDVEIYWKNYKK